MAPRQARPQGQSGPHEPRKGYRDPAVSRRVYLPPSVRLRRAREVLRLAASARLDLDEIAVLSGVNQDHFLKLFRKAGEVSPMRQVRRMGLEEVAEKIRTTDASLEVLAHEFNYADGSSLSRAFRRMFGRRPSELRNHRVPG